MNQPKGGIFSRFYHGRDRRGDDVADAARAVGSGAASGVESNENLVNPPGGTLVGMGHGAMMEVMGIDNQIMMTSEVVVKVSTRH